jgi:hypothetical protein
MCDSGSASCRSMTAQYHTLAHSEQLQTPPSKYVYVVIYMCDSGSASCRSMTAQYHTLAHSEQLQTLSS